GPKRPLNSPSALTAPYRSPPDSAPATFSSSTRLSSIVRCNGRGATGAGAGAGAVSVGSSSARYGYAVATPWSSAASDQVASSSPSRSCAGFGNPLGKAASCASDQSCACADQSLSSYAP